MQAGLFKGCSAPAPMDKLELRDRLQLICRSRPQQCVRRHPDSASTELLSVHLEAVSSRSQAFERRELFGWAGQ